MSPVMKPPSQLKNRTNVGSSSRYSSRIAWMYSMSTFSPRCSIASATRLA